MSSRCIFCNNWAAHSPPGLTAAARRVCRPVILRLAYMAARACCSGVIST
nr:MAG TPA: hypothetical protein [Caudoviricetes sp.]